ncbi:tRNA (adenine(22)-N(1))-methyltransferase [Alicyclobacillus fodiniaquatilis]|uniref:tRNA (Adenine(22)-N(1))-methyltransferase n=1 Tax=Alicyclobacillus fodiniaquatilis TaxID=1661150 RepID=A0ABW4JMZ8_9BACL
MPIAISKRMEAIVSHVPQVASLGDIGTDHAFIPIYAVQTGLASRAIASDLREGPLGKARENVTAHQLGEKVELRLGDGFMTLQPGEAQVIVTAGIGGHIQAGMVTSAMEVAKQARRIIFQPMNAGHLLRCKLDELGFHIEAEQLVEDDGRLYEIIAVTYTGQRDEAYAAYRHGADALTLAYTFGPQLLRNPDELLLQRLQREIDKLIYVRKQVLTGATPEAKAKADEVEQQISRLTAWKEGRGSR